MSSPIDPISDRILTGRFSKAEKSQKKVVIGHEFSKPGIEDKASELHFVSNSVCSANPEPIRAETITCPVSEKARNAKVEHAGTDLLRREGEGSEGFEASVALVHDSRELGYGPQVFPDMREQSQISAEGSETDAMIDGDATGTEQNGVEAEDGDDIYDLSKLFVEEAFAVGTETQSTTGSGMEEIVSVSAKCKGLLVELLGHQMLFESGAVDAVVGAKQNFAVVKKAVSRFEQIKKCIREGEGFRVFFLDERIILLGSDIEKVWNHPECFLSGEDLEKFRNAQVCGRVWKMTEEEEECIRDRAEEYSQQYLRELEEEIEKEIKMKEDEKQQKNAVSENTRSRAIANSKKSANADSQLHLKKTDVGIIESQTEVFIKKTRIQERAIAQERKRKRREFEEEMEESDKKYEKIKKLESQKTAKFLDEQNTNKKQTQKIKSKRDFDSHF